MMELTLPLCEVATPFRDGSAGRGGCGADTFAAGGAGGGVWQKADSAKAGLSAAMRERRMGFMNFSVLRLGEKHSIGQIGMGVNARNHSSLDLKGSKRSGYVCCERSRCEGNANTFAHGR